MDPGLRLREVWLGILRLAFLCDLREIPRLLWTSVSSSVKIGTKSTSEEILTKARLSRKLSFLPSFLNTPVSAPIQHFKLRPPRAGLSLFLPLSPLLVRWERTQEQLPHSSGKKAPEQGSQSRGQRACRVFGWPRGLRQAGSTHLQGRNRRTLIIRGFPGLLGSRSLPRVPVGSTHNSRPANAHGLAPQPCRKGPRAFNDLSPRECRAIQCWA